MQKDEKGVVGRGGSLSKGLEEEVLLSRPGVGGQPWVAGSATECVLGGWSSLGMWL